jgi:hypothetical protein
MFARFLVLDLVNRHVRMIDRHSGNGQKG